MGHGRPALWSTLLSLPFLGGGFFLNVFPDRAARLTGGAIPSPDLQLLGIPIGVFGAFVLVIGLYVQVVEQPAPSLGDDEEVIDTRHPSQRVAVSKIALSVPFLAGAAYLLVFTLVPYVYPTAAFLVGLYLFSGGLTRYWANTLTTYYVTSDRVISEYRFISLRRQELPLDKVRGVEERKSIMEAIVGLGNLRIASGGGGGSVQVILRNMGESTEFTDKLRELIT